MRRADQSPVLQRTSVTVNSYLMARTDDECLQINLRSRGETDCPKEKDSCSETRSLTLKFVKS